MQRGDYHKSQGGVGVFEEDRPHGRVLTNVCSVPEWQIVY